MKKLNNVASLLATVALTASSAGASAQTIDNWLNPAGLPWKNGTNELCWRDANWTPATAFAECDGALKPQPKSAPEPAPAPAPHLLRSLLLRQRRFRYPSLCQWHP